MTLAFQTRLKHSAIDLKIVNNRLLAFHNDGTISTLSPKNLSLITTEKPIEIEKELHKFSKGAILSNSGKLIYIDNNSKECYLKNVSDDTKGNIIARNNSPIEVCSISPKDTIIATGAADGRVNLWAAPTWENIGRTLPRPDYISAISFCDEGNFLAIGGFDGKLYIHDINTLEIIKAINFLNPIEDVMFICEKTLIAIDRKGFVALINLESGEVINQYIDIAEWPTKLCLSNDKRHILLGTRGNEILLIDVKSGLSFPSIPLPNSGITSILCHNNEIIIGFLDGNIGKLGTPLEFATLSEFLNRRNLKKASNFIEKRPWTIIHPTTKLFDEAWPETLNRAKLQIELGNVKVAEMLLSVYLFDPRKKDEFEKLFKKAELLKRFNQLVENEQWAEALALADEHKTLESSKAWERAQKHWQKLIAYLFSLAQEDSKFYKNKIFKMLSPFALIPSKRSFINSFLENVDAYKQAKSAIISKDLDRFFLLVMKHHFLKETALFTKVSQKIGVLLEKLENYSKGAEYDKALQMCKYLQLFPEVAQENKKLEEELIKRQKAQKFIQEENYPEAAKILSDSKNSLLCPEYKIVIERFKYIANGCKGLAKEGKTVLLKPHLFPFFEAGVFKTKIISIYEESCLNELKNSLQDNDRGKILTGIKNFAISFGVTADLISILEDSKLKEAWSMSKKPLLHTLPDTIFEIK